MYALAIECWTAASRAVSSRGCPEDLFAGGTPRARLQAARGALFCVRTFHKPGGDANRADSSFGRAACCATQQVQSELDKQRWAPIPALERLGGTLQLPHSHLDPLGPAHGLQGAPDEHDRPAVLQGALRAPALMGEPSDEFQVT